MNYSIACVQCARITFVHNARLGQQVSSPTQYFWYRTTLMVSKDINTPEIFNWKIALALIIAWILVYMCMIKGIASSGKVREDFYSQSISSQSFILTFSGCIRDRHISVYRPDHFLLSRCDVDGYVGWCTTSLHAKGALSQFPSTSDILISKETLKKYY